MSIRAQSWHATHTFSHNRFPAERLAAERTASVSVCLPARDEAGTIGPILDQLVMLASRGVLDQIVVVDNSQDGTAEIARSFGVEVYEQEKLMPELGPVLGKGDAMWRSLHLLTGEIVCFLDADSEQFGAHFACGLIGPLLCGPEFSFVKGFYRRPFRVGEMTLPEGGGRVTELMARPLLNLFYAVLQAVTSRLERDGRLTGPLPGTFLAPGEDGMRALRSYPIERPPLAGIRAAA
jgi:glucosyl-3-phosphoglycerate synthase